MDKYVDELRETVKLIELAIDETDGRKAHFILKKAHSTLYEAWIGWMSYIFDWD